MSFTERTKFGATSNAKEYVFRPQCPVAPSGMVELFNSGATPLHRAENILAGHVEGSQKGQWAIVDKQESRLVVFFFELNEFDESGEL